MFHTVELFHKIDYLQYLYLDFALKGLSKIHGTKYFLQNKKNGTEKICNVFTKKGITIKLIENQIDGEITMHQIEIIFTPKRLLVEKEFIEVTKQEDLIKISKEFKKVMKELKQKYNSKSKGKYKPQFIFDILDKYKVKRIDYCVNIYFKDLKKTLELIRRGDIPHNFKPHLEYDPIGKRSKTPKESFYLKSKCVIINIYGKYYQMIKDKYYSSIDISGAKEIIRFEIQCGYDKVIHIKNKFKLKNRTIFDMAQNEIAQYILLFYLDMTLGTGDYFTLDRAREIINKSNATKEKTKKKMIDIIELVSCKKSVSKAREAYLGDIKRFNKMLKKINELGINPVTIPVRWNIDFIPNPIHEIKKIF